MRSGKSKRSRSVIRDRNRYGSRRQNTRPPLPVIVVVCDDTKTAVSYFEVLKRLVKDKLTLHVEGKTCDWAKPSEVIALSKRWLDGLQAVSADESDVSAVWALIDMEATAGMKAAATKAKRDGKKVGVSVALSNPCYEVWTLLHLLDTGEVFHDCDAVLARVEKEWKRRFKQAFGKKAQADYSKIIGDRVEASRRARQHHAAGDPSWTEVYLLIEAIERRSALNDPTARSSGE